MNKEEVKQWLRNLIDSSIEIQDENLKHIYNLCYNNSYVRALKLSKITGNSVDVNDFTGGVELITTNTIYNNNNITINVKNIAYLIEKYSKSFAIKTFAMDYEILLLFVDILREYNEYKGYIYWYNYV